MKLKYVVVLVVIASFGAIIYGFLLDNTPMAHKFIGFGTLGLFFVAMPLFLYKESRGKKMEDYMLTKENIDKMRSKERDTEKN